MFSCYPAQRKRVDPDSKTEVGVAGTLELLGTQNISTQPILSLDWSADKEVTRRTSKRREKKKRETEKTERGGEI